jgi:hypothetical protein
MFKVPEQYRVPSGKLGSDSSAGNNGAFLIPSFIFGRALFVVASDTEGWEHVSVHVSAGKDIRTPAWGEMCQVKDMFWGKEDTVLQLHLPKSSFVDNHPNVLHMWRPVDKEVLLPPKNMV